jgi:uracil-DNA glycosylase
MVKDSQLSSGAEAYVGKYYGKTTRIIVVSLDIGGYAENIDDRRKTIENLQYEKCNPHMKGTYTILETILKNEINEDNPFLYYSMTNSSKCSVLDNTMNMAPKFFFDNCKEFALEEIFILEPQIIITQGTKAKQILDPEKLDDDIIIKAINKLNIIEEIVYSWVVPVVKEFVFLTKISDKKIITICTPHPSARDGRWQKFLRMSLTPIVAIAIILTNDPFKI